MRALTLAMLLLACKGDKGGSEDDSGGGEHSGGGGDDSGGGGGDDSSASTLPDDPTPFTLTVSGDYSDTLVFDDPECTWTSDATNFRAFWRNAAREHVFVLAADILGPFTGPGTYTQDDAITRVKLQEEAGSSGPPEYFESDADQGDTVSVTVTSVDDAQAWGEFTFSGLHSDTGAITVTPVPVPIWCPTMNGD